MAKLSKILSVSQRRRMHGKLSILLIFLAIYVISYPAKAETSVYVFDPNQSTVRRSGGISGLQKTFAVAGQFRLTVDLEAGIVSFEKVDANLTDETGSIYGQSLDEIFNMTGLSGTIIDGTTIQFEGKSADGTESDVSLKLTLGNDSAQLTGSTTPPPNSADMFLYNINAVTIKKYSGGTGEPNDPYQIATAEDLILLGDRSEDYDKHFILIADIDLDPNLSGRKVFDRAVIAPDINDVNDGFQGIPFAGVFDGNGHRISNFTNHSDSMEKVGLFGYLDHGSLIKDLGLEDVNVTGFYEVGSLAGVNDGSVVNCYSTGFVGGGSDVGGLIGYLPGLVSNCYSACIVSGDSEIGGLVGDSDSGSVINCYSTGDVNGISEVGGLMGFNEGEIINCYSISITSGKTQVGGLVGSNGIGVGQVTNSYSSGLVNGESDVGGLIGFNGSGFATNSFWDTQTSGQTTSGGGTGLTTAEMQNIDTYLNSGWDFIDETFNGTHDFWQILPGNYPRHRYHIGDGPIMPEGTGTVQEPYLIRDARNLGTVWYKPLAHYRLEDSVDLSGIIWSIAVVPWFGGTFDGNGYVISNLHIQGSGYIALFGQLESRAVISNLGLEAVDVNGIGSYVGGIVGENNGSITSIYCTGTITGYSNVGGLTGNNRGSIDASYSKVTVSGDWYIGGLVGDNRGSISTSFSTGLVSGNETVGGLVGLNWEGTVDKSFWDTQTSGQMTSAGGTGKSTNEMQTAGTFIEAGWDFVDEMENGTEDIWWIDEGQDYPRLWWELSD